MTLHAREDRVKATAGVTTSVLTGHVWRDRRDHHSLRWQPRQLVVSTSLLLAIAVVAAVSLTTGDFHIPLDRVLATLTGHGSSADHFIVITLRLPRLLAAILIGAALGMSGAVFQSLTRNPLGSPDIIGFTSGAATGAVAEIVIFHGSQFAISTAAIVGGLATAALVYLVSSRHGRVTGYRLILVGIGAGAILTSVTSYLLTRATLYEAQDAQVWLIGSLNGIGWQAVGPLAIVVVALMPVVLALGRPLNVMQLGEESAKGLGVPVERTRLLLIIAATALAAAATAAAGPISFVALAAPQLARRLAGGSTVPLALAAVMGALLLVAGDFGAQRVIPSTPLPVGVMTGLLGGAYLCWLLAHQWRNKA